jgi:hypothetical protein
MVRWLPRFMRQEDPSYTYLHTFLHLYRYLYPCIHIHIYIHIYIYIYIYIVGLRVSKNTIALWGKRIHDVYA